MGKRKIKNTPVAVLVALLALFLSTGIAAGGPPAPATSCALVTSTGASTPVSVKTCPGTSSGVCETGGAWPVPGSTLGSSGTLWRYQLVNGTGTQAAILVPVCYPHSNNYFVPANLTTGTVYPAPAITGSTNWNGFGVWDVYDNLVTITSIGSSPFVFGTDNVNPLPIRATPMQFKVGKDYYYCPNIAGPDCEEYVNPLVPVTRVQTLAINGAFFKLTRSIYGCISEVSVCENADFTGCYNIEPGATIGGETVLNCADTSGMGNCQECSIITTGSPTCTTLTSGGTPYQSCVCPSGNYWIYDTNADNAQDAYYPTPGRYSPYYKTTKVKDCSTSVPAGLRVLGTGQ